VGEKGGGSSEGAAAMTAVLWLASLMEKATPAPPLAAEGTAAPPDLAEIERLLGEFLSWRDAARTAVGLPERSVAIARRSADSARAALLSAIRALAAPSPAPREATPETVSLRAGLLAAADLLWVWSRHGNADLAAKWGEKLRAFADSPDAGPSPAPAQTGPQFRTRYEAKTRLARWYEAAIKQAIRECNCCAYSEYRDPCGRCEQLLAALQAEAFDGLPDLTETRFRRASPAPAQRDATCAGCGHAPHGEGECAGTVTEISQCGCLAAAPSPSGNPGKETNRG
jgi:hypothetical protein